jgi:DNA polymerase-1
MSIESQLYLIDGSTIVYRAYHAIRNLSNSKGFPTNAIYGFVSMLAKLLQEKNPQYLGIVFDPKGPTFRHGMYEQYKATRPRMPDDLVMQIPFIKQIVEGLNINALELAGYEADDVIGTVVKQAGPQGISTIIISGDKDFYQLIDEGTSLLDTKNNQTITVKDVRERFGVDPDKVVEVLGLSGDASDNIPGVAGIGIKTAIKLIQEYGSIKDLYDRLEEIPQESLRKKLTHDHENAFLSKELVTINTHLPLPFELEHFRITKPDRESLEPIFRELEFSRFLKEFLPEKTPRASKTFSLVQTEKALEGLVRELRERNAFALKVETTSEDHMLQNAIAGLSISFQPHHAFYLPVGHATPQGADKLERGSVFSALKPILEDANVKKLGHNLKKDYKALSESGIRIRGIEGDTMIASYLLNPSKRNHALEEITFEHLNYPIPTLKEATTQGKQSIPFESLSLEQASEYSCEQVNATLLLWELLLPKLKHKELWELFRDMEMPVVEVLSRMELAGVKVNADSLSVMSQELGEALKALEKKIHTLAGEAFNINSPRQLSTILFEKLKLPVVSRTKTGFSTNIEVLKKLASDHAMPALVLEYRSISKLKSTYIDALPRLVNPKTGRIHTTFNQAVTATGRLSSSDPNLQNIPIRGDWGEKMRQAFIPEEGALLLSADYSQIELRIMAHLSGDSSLREAFLKDEDVHARTAAELYQISPENVTASMRRVAKIINFGVIYGMSHIGLSQELDISWGEAKRYIESYFERYQGVKDYIDTSLEKARQKV